MSARKETASRAPGQIPLSAAKSGPKQSKSRPSKTSSSRTAEPTNKPTPAKEETEDESASESSSESSGSSASDNKPSAGPRQQGHTAAAPQHRARATFKPPEGFTPLAPPSSNPSSTMSQVLSASNLAGKQLWHITAPSSAPIKNIKEVALEQVARQEPILTHDAKAYGFVQDDAASSDRSQLLVRGPDGAQYQLAPSQFSQSLHLQLVQLPNPPQTAQVPDSSLESQPTTSRGTGRPPRPQPAGLRMRFLPSAFGTGKAGRIGAGSSSNDEESDEDNSASTFRMPAGVDVGSGEKRKKPAAADAPEPESQVPSTQENEVQPRQKKSKHRHQDSSQHSILSSQQNGFVPDSQPSRPSPSQDANAESLPDGTTAEVKTSRRHNETPEERSRRKEDKEERRRKKRLLKEERNSQNAVEATVSESAQQDDGRDNDENQEDKREHHKHHRKRKDEHGRHKHRDKEREGHRDRHRKEG
ncbi:MAG: histone H2B [Chaenotheca gracillima]|nr:MAG: histone H2B [Chaenotheca gracillima]